MGIKNSPLKLGTVWTARARIQRINGSKWESLAECIDTPNAIRAELARLEAKGYSRGELWVYGQATGRKLALDLR